ncbi:cupin-like domain-containing protein [Legionella parisiensis]|uniref:JmjC domain-containing protein n=1 Tax=Legionella parisiensis TaxID=45071 RepID=A0A1E5JUU6_9GAMM|nr:cupin-like domain-containing protein [Legionella parisiensis]KTD43143.1 eukaryotic small stress protein PASS1 [Legionella parisiensis]OEH48260.1 hypothetical protein lpari_00752 [Legionella parisiensis]STX77778.1 eukaryotic small stress protein [Legionella parisiensis]
MNPPFNILASHHLPQNFTSDVPVVIKHALNNQPAFLNWSPESLRSDIGRKKVLVDKSTDGLFRVNPKGGAFIDEMLEMSFTDFLEKISNPTEEALRLYLIHSSIPINFPELMPQMTIPHYVDQKRLRHINLWVGQKGNISPLHFDTNNNILCEVFGRKKIILYPPQQGKLLYPYSCFTKAPYVSPIRADQPDFKTYPKFASAKPYEVILHPTDIMYIPPFWWHQVFNLDMTISVNFWWRLYKKQCINPSFARIVTYRFYNRMKDFIKRV